jgi:hypothetical protein
MTGSVIRLTIVTFVVGALLAAATLFAGCDKKSSAGPAPDLLPLDTLVRGCVIHGACEGESVDNCVEDYLEGAVISRGWTSMPAEINRYYNCVAGAQTCGEAQTCEGTECTDEDAFCEGDTLVFCEYGYLLRLDCSDRGDQCMTYSWGLFSGISTCGYDTCTQDQIGEWCDGNIYMSCFGGVMSRLDCADVPALINGVCHEVENNAECVTGPTETCDDATFQDRCEGNVLVACQNDVVVRWDCAEAPYYTGCSVIGDQAQCTISGTLCTSQDNGCAGDVLRLCVDGALQEFDCADIGGSCLDLGAESRCNV